MLFSWSCGKKKEPATPAGGPPSQAGTPQAGSPQAPSASSNGFQPESIETTGLPNGLRVTATPEGGTASTSQVANLDIACGRATPADTVATKRRFETLFVVDKPGVYTFALMTDDDSVLSVGGKEVGRAPTLRDTKVPVEFSKAGVYRLTLDLTNNLGPYCADIKMSLPGSDAFAPIPAASLFVPR